MAAPRESPLWDVELSREVVAWHATLGPRDRAFADRALDRLAEAGPDVRMPHGRALGDGLYELRLTCEGVSRRITYAPGAGRGIVVLTTFRKQRDRERHEIDRARLAKDRHAARERATGRER